VLGNADLNDAVDETFTVLEDSVAGFTFYVDVAEYPSFDDAYSGIRMVYATVTDTTGFTDTYTVVANFNPTVADVMSIMDMVCVAGWFVIDDSQTASWVNVNTAQTANWGSIPTTVPCV
jgi:glutamine synthetase